MKYIHAIAKIAESYVFDSLNIQSFFKQNSVQNQSGPALFRTHMNYNFL